MFTTKSSIKYWSEDDRPREKLILRGERYLSNSELLAILIGFGTKEKSALDLAQDLLGMSNNDLRTFSRQSINDLQRVRGIGKVKAVTILAALELGRRRREDMENESFKVENPKILYEYLRPFYQDLNIEKFYVLHLNKSLKIIAQDCLSVGGTSGTIVDQKLVFKRALETGATSIILSHNHPGGTTQPSEHDIRLTKEIVKFGKMIGIQVHDHLIYTDNGYYSFADKGKI